MALQGTLLNRLIAPDRLADGRKRTILDGPSLPEIAIALITGNRVNQPALPFLVDGIGIVELRVSALGREDGSGESWNLDGYLSDGTYWSACYHSKRHGTITAGGN
jgi:hypothetical protein